MIVMRNVETIMKYQLEVGSTERAASRMCTASVEMPESSGSVVPMTRLAEKPPETPAKAAARPAIG